MREHYTVKEFRLIAELREQKMPWPLVAERLGRPQRDMQTMFYRWRRGQHKGRMELLEQRRKLAEQLAEEGLPVRLIASRLDMHISHANNLLLGIGLDAEMREELRNAV